MLPGPRIHSRDLTVMNRYTLPIVLLCLLLGLPVVAQTEGDANVSEATETASADAEREPETPTDPQASFFATTTVTAVGREVDAFEIVTPVSVIRSEEIERQAPENAADLLRAQPGVDVNGVGPNQMRPVIRGQRGLRVLLLENGLPLNNPRRQTDFGEITGLVNLDDVETMEVVRGPASVLYGSGAIGGVLNLVTRVPSSTGPRYGGAVGARYGSAADQLRGHASVDGRSERFAFSLGLSVRDAEDYEAAAGTFGNITLPSETTVIDTGLRDDSAYAFFGARLADDQELSLRYSRYRAEQTGFGFVEPALLGESEDFRIRILYPSQDFDRFTFGYVASALDAAAADSLEVRAYYQANERFLANDIDINIGPLFPGAPDSSVEADTLNFTDLESTGLRLEAIKGVRDRHLLTYGAEVYRDDSFNTDFSTTTTTLRFPFPPFQITRVSTDSVANAPNATNAGYGVFAQGEIAASEELTLTAGARFQNVETRAEPTPGWDISGLDFDDSSVVGTLNLIYRVNDNIRLLGSWGTAFRAPNIIERLFNGATPEGAGFQILNPDLTSEDSESVDLGIKYRRRNAFMEAIVFETTIDDGIIQYFLTPAEIAALPPDVREEIDTLGVSFVVQQRNIDRIRYRGLELALGYRSERGLSVGGNYTYLDGERISQSAVPIENQFSDKINAFVRWEPPRRNYWLEYRLRRNGDEPTRLGPNDPVPPVGEVLPAFTVHALSGGVTFESGALEHALSLVIDNLSDELYAEFSNATFFRPQPRRNVIATYALKF